MSKELVFVTNRYKPVYTRESFGGRDFLVVPFTMIREGVHAGSRGPLFYEGHEIRNSVPSWDRKPVLINHPVDGGSAENPVVLRNQSVGFLRSTAYQDINLNTMAWLEEGRLRKLAPLIYRAILNGEDVEVSTGLFTDNEELAGDHLGKKYVALAKNHRPDHLAILTDQKGACSNQDGCGVIRNEACSPYETMLLVTNAVGEKKDHHFVDLFDDHAVISLNGKFWKLPFEVVEGGVRVGDAATEVRRVTQYLPITSNEEPGMFNKKTFVDALIANSATMWEEEDREFLMNQSDEKLQKKFGVTANMGKACDSSSGVQNAAPVTPAPKACTCGAATHNAAPVVPAKPVAQTVEQYIENSPTPIRAMLRTGLAAHTAEKERLIGIITSNAQNPFNADYLRTKEVDELTGLAKLATPAVQNEGASYRGVPMYVGAATPAGPTHNAGDIKEEALALPTMNFSDPVADDEE